ncbi:hypothetical protein F4555_000282 [Mobiluncus mulieris]|uniref:Uncharacterized protein n=1 Tax=Mobiluncus mulieris TaxID=2052 RepID=A0A8G2M5Y5_9ACTO|nr:hypothetical protein [Mobiluncus mulieris]MBB5845486.1 hypothetical protein [Mobiluncus mulieris]STO15844.1 Uncharacterised protein [Mobiluncus mulieris]
MKHELRKSRGWGSLNRLGIATLSGLLVVGLTPTFANVVFASEPTINNSDKTVPVKV